MTKNDTRKTKAQLIEELQLLRQQVTEQQEPLEETAELLISEKQMLQALFDTLPDRFYFKDKESRFIRVSQSMADWFGLKSPADVIGKTDFDFFSKEYAQKAREEELEILKTGQMRQTGKKEILPDGQETWILATKALLTDEDGNVIGTFGTSKDITGLKQTQNALTKLASELELVAEVSAAISTIMDTTELLQKIVDATKERFGLYHSHIYLFDEAQENLVLIAGAGEVGRQMVNEGWQIPLDREQSLVARAARFKEGFIVNDIQNDPDWLPNRLLPDTHSEMAVPLITGERVLGVLDVQSNEEGYFTSEDIQIQTTLAIQIAVSLENARLFEKTQETLGETAKLYEVGRQVNEASTLNDMMVAISQAGESTNINQILLTPFERNAAGQVDGLLVTASWFSGHGTPPPVEGVRFPLETIPYKALLFNHEPVFIDDILHDDRLDFEAVASLQEAHVQSMAILPLWAGDRQLGVLFLRAEEVYVFTESERRIYTSLARQVAVAVENQQLLAETQSILAEIETTQRRYTIQTWDTYRKRNTDLIYEQSRFEQTKTTEDFTGASQETALLTEGGDSRTLDNGLKDDTSPQPLPAESKADLLVPLKVRGEEIGVLGIAETSDQLTWSPEEIALVEAIAEQVAQAAENLRLIDETQQAAAREARVNEIGEKIQAAQSLEEALRVAVKEVGMSLEVPQTAVQLKVSD